MADIISSGKDDAGVGVGVQIAFFIIDVEYDKRVQFLEFA